MLGSLGKLILCCLYLADAEVTTLVKNMRLVCTRHAFLFVVLLKDFQVDIRQVSQLIIVRAIRQFLQMARASCVSFADISRNSST